MRRFLRLRVLVPVALVGALVVAFGLYWFQPWKLFTHSHVDEALPGYSSSATQAVTPPPTTTSAATPASSAAATTPRGPAAPAPVVLSQAAFRSGEHSTSGTALLIRLPDGSLVVRLENFDTSDGPDVRVILASTPAGSHGVGDYLHLGHLKGTSGNQNYPVEAGSNVSGYRSVVIWCKRFNAVFGSADLTPIG